MALKKLQRERANLYKAAENRASEPEPQEVKPDNGTPSLSQMTPAKRLHIAHLQSAYAFSYFMATGPLSKNYFKAAVSPVLKQLQGQYLEAEECRAAALKSAPESPEVLLESALALFHKSGGSVDDTKKRCLQACNYLRQAAKLAPDWADTHYWLGQCLVDYTQFEKEKQPLLEEALRAYQQAEQHDSALRSQTLMGRVYAYAALKQPEKALEALEALATEKPAVKDSPFYTNWKNALTKQGSAEKT